MHAYGRIATSGENISLDEFPTDTKRRYPNGPRASKTVYFLVFIGLAGAAVIGFISGMLFTRSAATPTLCEGDTSDTAPRIPLSTINHEFVFDSPFAKEPPSGPGSGEASEPIWDTLVPTGLGYFKDETLAPRTSIPTVFHQLHCLYTLRRAYYFATGGGGGEEDLQDFDLGRDRRSHVAHCFDYLQQGLTCLSDTTVEPGVDEEHGFLGYGLTRQCRDFDSLKQYLEERRVFNASGFLAHELMHGKVTVGVRD